MIKVHVPITFFFPARIRVRTYFPPIDRLPFPLYIIPDNSHKQFGDQNVATIDPMKGMITSYIATPQGQEMIRDYLSSPEGQKAICEFVNTPRAEQP